MKVLYYMAFDNQIMIWPLSPTRYFKWLCQKSLKIYTIFTNSSLSSMFFKNFNFEAFRGIFWPWCRKQKSLRIKFYPRKHPLKNILVHFEQFQSFKSLAQKTSEILDKTSGTPVSRHPVIFLFSFIMSGMCVLCDVRVRIVIWLNCRGM